MASRPGDGWVNQVVVLDHKDGWWLLVEYMLSLLNSIP